MRENPPPRAIDHLVLPTGSLERARERLTALGFTVAPNGIHPFGTENCCIYFADGTFLEPLALADEKVAAKAARSGNVFVARDAAYRFRNGEEGFSALVFATLDAAADHASFIDAGTSAGGMLAFSRDFVDASGRTDTASFRLAFAADLRAPDAFFFTCQRVDAPNVDRAALQNHANAVTGIKRVVLAAPRVDAFSDLAQAVSNAVAAGGVDGSISFTTANAAIDLVDHASLRRDFGALSGADPGLRLRAIVFEAADLHATEVLFKSSNVTHERHGPRLVVQPAPGQGAIFAFEAS